MLIIRRRPGESILIGDHVEVEILEISPTRVKLGVSAPEHVNVVRKEVVLTRQENLDAARDHPSVGWDVLLRRLPPMSCRPR